MGLALDDLGKEIEAVARSFTSRHATRKAARATLEADEDDPPEFWESLIDVGWLGLHLDEAVGGQGAGLPELAIVVEQLGRELTPGPFLPTVTASAVVAAAGSDELRRRVLPDLASGARLGAVGLAGSLTVSGSSVSGDAGPVLGAGLAGWLVLTAGADLVVVDRDASGVRIAAAANLDPTRRAATVQLDDVRLEDGQLLVSGASTAVRIARTLASAEAAGLAAACTEMATGYAKERQQFGRTIGTFQAVKHHCANMLVETEVATATAWDAAAAADQQSAEADYAAAAAATLALPAALRCAKLNTQVHGGIGYTWEHDAHLYVRRAQALQAAYGPVSAAQEDVAARTAEGAERRPALELPEDAEAVRADVRSVAERIRALPEDERMTALVDEGWAFPHWPKPWGRGAGAVQQLVAEEELRDLPHPLLGIGGWITQTLAGAGTEDQQARWIRQSQLGEISWCQLFSEPNAGSDAAGITTRGVRTDGGWLVTGQKVWTSLADFVSHGFATVRTDPDAPKHAGVTMMVIDMKAPGLTVRPLRELTGEAQFSEVFLDEVFVPDEDVVGEVNGGWSVARATLGNERVSIGGGMGGADASALLPVVDTCTPGDRGHLRTVGTLVAQNHALRVLNLRSVARAVRGAGPGPEGNVTKLLTAEHAQVVHEFALALYGADTLLTEGPAGPRIAEFLFTRQNTIAGGTSEITRNQIAERILGLPRDPLIR